MRHTCYLLGLCLALVGAGSLLAGETALAVTTADGLSLKAKLTFPDGATGKVPGVLLVHGSGPNDMDETIPGGMTSTGEKAKLFRDTADALVAAGYAVLRYDKRGAAHDGDFAGWANSPEAEIYRKATLGDLVSDATLALGVLRAQPQVDAEKTLILGHSEGTWIAPAVARADGHVAGLVLMGVMARNLRETIGYQVGERARKFAWSFVDANHDGVITREEVLASDCSGVASFPTDDASLTKFFSHFDRSGDGRLDHDELDPYFEFRVLNAVNRTTSPWIASHYVAAPNVETLTEFKRPILLLEGLADEQTLPVESRMLELSFEAKGQKNLEAVYFSGLGHGFSPPLNGRVPTVGPIAPRVLAALASWMGQKFPTNAPPAPSAMPAAPMSTKLAPRRVVDLPDDPSLRLFLGR